MKKLVILFLAVAILLLTACKKEEPVVETTTAQTTTQKVEPVYYNFLTGVKKKDDSRPRPVAVTVNNIEAALPQYGISDADIIMEFPAEGGITRMLALYSDYRNMPNVCSIRSCRYYFPIFAQGFGAAYFCYGSNETLGTPTLKRIGIDYIDGNKAGDTLVFERDSERLQSYSLEHTAYLKGENMKKIFDKYKFSKEIPDGFGDTVFNFSQKTVKANTACAEVTASFSNYYESKFTYDTKLKAYLKDHNGDPHMDGKSGKQLSFDNVLILQTEVNNYKGTVLVEINWKGGTGYYITKGTVKPILWEKESEASPIKLYDLDKKTIKINTGKTYIGVGASEVILPEVPETTTAATTTKATTTTAVSTTAAQ